jgi:hypothetical protein
VVVDGEIALGVAARARAGGVLSLVGEARFRDEAEFFAVLADQEGVPAVAPLVVARAGNHLLRGQLHLQGGPKKTKKEKKEDEKLKRMEEEDGKERRRTSLTSPVFL